MLNSHIVMTIFIILLLSPILIVYNGYRFALAISQKQIRRWIAWTMFVSYNVGFLVISYAVGYLLALIGGFF